MRGNVNLTYQTLRRDKLGFELAYGDSFQVIGAGSCTGQVDLFDISQFEKLMRFPADLYDRWTFYCGLNTEEFHQVQLRLLLEGCPRENFQVFVDSNGTAMHQAVWLRAEGCSLV